MWHFQYQILGITLRSQTKWRQLNYKQTKKWQPPLWIVPSCLWLFTHLAALTVYGFGHYVPHRYVVPWTRFDHNNPNKFILMLDLSNVHIWPNIITIATVFIGDWVDQELLTRRSDTTHDLRTNAQGLNKSYWIY